MVKGGAIAPCAGPNFWILIFFFLGPWGPMGPQGPLKINFLPIFYYFLYKKYYFLYKKGPRGPKKKE